MNRYSHKKPFSVLLLTSLFLVYFIEIIYSRSFIISLNWAFYFFAAFFVFIVMTLFYSISGRVYISFFITFIFFFVLASISYFKFAARGEPLYRSDLNLAFQIIGVADRSNIVITKYIVVSAVTGVCASMGLFFFKPPNLPVKIRIIYCFLSLSILLCISNLNLSFLNREQDYNRTGFITGFCFVTEKMEFVTIEALARSFNEPKEDIIDTSTNELDEQQVLITQLEQLKERINGDGSNPEVLPNIIILLSESFWDITQIEKLSFSEEPIPNFKRIRNESISGNMISYTFGGGTANVEFEILTGCLKRFLNETETDFQSMVQNETMSLAHIFKRSGYETIGIHTYQRTFYNRDKAYPLLGFDRWIGLEDIEEYTYDGRYVSDKTLIDEIIKKLEDGDNPKFIFAISMENHQPYTKDKYPNTSIEVLNTDMNASMKDSVEIFLHGLNNADKQLGRLMEYLEESDKPTTLLFFGDHQPTLGAEKGLHRYAGQVKDAGNLTLEDYQSILSVPFTLWSNYKNETDYIETIGPNFLGNYLMNYICMQKPLFYYVLDEMYENNFHFISRKEMYLDVNNIPVNPDSISEESRRILDMYQALQQYLLDEDNAVRQMLQQY